MALYIVQATGSDNLKDTIILERDNASEARSAVVEGLQEDRPGVTITVDSCARATKGQARSAEFNGARVWSGDF